MSERERETEREQEEERKFLVSLDCLRPGVKAFAQFISSGVNQQVGEKAGLPSLRVLLAFEQERNNKSMRCWKVRVETNPTE